MQTRQAVQQTQDAQAASQSHSVTNQETTEPLRRSAHPTALIQRALADPVALTRAEVLQLHRTIGNRALGDLVSAGNKLRVQAKLVVSSAGDKYEQEADRVAKQVVEHSGASTSRARQRQRREDDSEVQMKFTSPHQTGGGGAPVSPDVEAAIQNARGNGQAIPAQLRAPLEQSLGADFSGVRIHTGAQADTLNLSLQARAFTTGQDIFFRRGEYNPSSAAGRGVLAHELTHVMQQHRGAVPTSTALVSHSASKPLSPMSLQTNKLVVQRILDRSVWNYMFNAEFEKELNKADPNARAFIFFISSDWDFPSQKALLLNDKGEYPEKKALSFFAPQLGKLYKITKAIERKPEYKRFFTLTLNKLVQQGQKFATLCKSIIKSFNLPDNELDQAEKYTPEHLSTLLQTEYSERERSLESLEGIFGKEKAPAAVKGMRTKLEEFGSKGATGKLGILESDTTKVPRALDFIKNYGVAELNDKSQVKIVKGSHSMSLNIKKFDREPPVPLLDTAGYVINTATVAGRGNPTAIADQYKKDAFDNSKEMEKDLPYRMGLVVGVNLFGSIEKDKNWETVNHNIGAVRSYFPMSVFGFTWKPNWVKKNLQGKLTNTTVDLDELTIKFNDMTPSEKEIVSAYERKTVLAAQENIPYGAIRDVVTASEHTQEQVSHLKRYNRRVYIHNADDDAPSIKSAVEEMGKPSGVFSRYDAILSQLKHHPLLLVGGYEFRLGEGVRFLDPQKPGEFLTYLADVLNRAVRVALGSGLAVYPTEPNLLIKAYEKGGTHDFDLFANAALFEGETGKRRFKEGKTLWGNRAAEGRALRHNLLTSHGIVGKEDVEKNILYRPETAVATDPGRFKLSNEAPIPAKHSASRDEPRPATFGAMREQRGGSENREAFIAQLLADVITQNQSMADRRTFAREVGNALKLQQLGSEAADILLSPPTTRDLIDSELTAIMLHNNAIQKKICELAGIDYEQFSTRLRFEYAKQEPYDQLKNVGVTVGTEEGSTAITYAGSEVAPTKKLKPELAKTVDNMVQQVLVRLQNLQVGEAKFWDILKDTMDKIYKEVHPE